jgi:hypothetical protein
MWARGSLHYPGKGFSEIKLETGGSRGFGNENATDALQVLSKKECGGLYQSWGNPDTETFQ